MRVSLIFLLVMLVAVPLGALAFTGTDAEFERQFYFPPPEPKARDLDDVKLGQLEDAKYFAQFPNFDRSYAPIARKEALQKAQELVNAATQITHERFVLKVAEIAALANNAHTSVGRNAFMKNTARLPIRCFLFSDGLYVLYARRDLTQLLGARIEQIDGVGLQEIYRRIARYRAGVAGFQQRQLIPMLESPGLLFEAGVAKSSDGLNLSGVLSNGQKFNMRVNAETRDRSAWVSNTSRLIYPDTLSNVGMQSFLRQSKAQPVYLNAAQKLFWSEDLPRRGVYASMTHNGDGDEERIAPFLSLVEQKIKSQQPDYVVLDMRFNGGGDLTSTYAFATALPSWAPNANIYVLTSPWTFSAAITTTGALKQAGGARVTVVGEPVGDRLDFWAEGDAFDLPNSFVRVQYSTGRHVYNGPCTDRQTCYWLNEDFPVRVSTLEPDISAPFSFTAYRAGRDPALEAVFARESKR